MKKSTVYFRDNNWWCSFSVSDINLWRLFGNAFSQDIAIISDWYSRYVLFSTKRNPTRKLYTIRFFCLEFPDGKLLHREGKTYRSLKTMCIVHESYDYSCFFEIEVELNQWLWEVVALRFKAHNTRKEFRIHSRWTRSFIPALIARINT